MKILWKSWSLFCVSVLTFALNTPELLSLARSGIWLSATWQDGYRSTGEQVDGARRLVERWCLDDSKVAYCTFERKGPRPVERSRIIAMSWATSPLPVAHGVVEDVKGADAVVASQYDNKIRCNSEFLSDYHVVDACGDLNLWVKRTAIGCQHYARHSAQYMLECFSMAAFTVFIAVLLCLGGLYSASVGVIFLSVATYFAANMFHVVNPTSSMLSSFAAVAAAKMILRRYGIGEDRILKRQLGICFWTVACALFAYYGAMALSHTFVSPNGLGTVGGKAKLMYLAKGLPPGYFTDYGYSTYQPTYPPGAASLVLWCYSIAGGCGEWLTQLVTCVPLSMIGAFMFVKAKSCQQRILLLSFLISPLSLRLASQTYPECFVATCAIVGWRLIVRSNTSWIGWVVLGAGGWYKNEGVVYYLSIAAAVFAFTDKRKRSAVLLGIAAGAILPLCWHIFSWMSGGVLDGYTALADFDASKWIHAWKRILVETFALPWKYAFALPLGFLLFFYRRSRRLSKVCLVAFISAIAFSFVFSLSDAVNFEWHLNSAERLMWVPALLVLHEIIMMRPPQVRQVECAPDN